LGGTTDQTKKKLAVLQREVLSTRARSARHDYRRTRRKGILKQDSPGKTSGRWRKRRKRKRQ